MGREVVSVDVVVREDDGRVMRYSYSDPFEGDIDAPDPKYGLDWLSRGSKRELRITGLENAHRYRVDASFFVLTVTSDDPQGEP